MLCFALCAICPLTRNAETSNDLGLRDRNLAHQRLLLPQCVDLLVVPSLALRAKSQIEVENDGGEKQTHFVPC